MVGIRCNQNELSIPADNPEIYSKSALKSC